MIYDIETQFRIILMLTLFGIFLIATYDIFYYVVDYYKPKTWIKALAEVLFGGMQLLIAYRFSFEICDGYIPIYFFLFFGLGILIYLKLLKKTLIKDLPYIISMVNFIIRWLIKAIVFLFYSKEVVAGVKVIVRFIRKILGKLFKKVSVKVQSLFRKIFRQKKSEKSV